MSERDDDDHLDRLRQAFASHTGDYHAFKAEVLGSSASPGIRGRVHELGNIVQTGLNRYFLVEQRVTTAEGSLSRISAALDPVARKLEAIVTLDEERAKSSNWRAKVAATVVGGVLLVVLLAAGRLLIAGNNPTPDPEVLRAAVAETLRQTRVRPLPSPPMSVEP